jgi:hypothetical protein
MPVQATSPLPAIEDPIEIPMLYSRTQLALMVGGVCLGVVGLLGTTIYALFM